MLSSFTHLSYRKQTQVVQPALKCSKPAMWEDVRGKKGVKNEQNLEDVPCWLVREFKRMKAATAAAGKRNETKRGLDDTWRAAAG